MINNSLEFIQTVSAIDRHYKIKDFYLISSVSFGKSELALLAIANVFHYNYMTNIIVNLRPDLIFFYFEIR